MDDHAIKNVQDIDFNGQDLKLGIGKFVSSFSGKNIFGLVCTDSV
jgi:hypothetical protein